MKMHTYEIILYRKDGSGKMKKASTYTIGACQLQNEMKQLDGMVKDGVIADYEVYKVM
jgi:hypothetical protein